MVVEARDIDVESMTTVTIASEDSLLAKRVEKPSFKTEQGYVTFTGIVHL
jgi:hypothetical protein